MISIGMRPCVARLAPGVSFGNTSPSTPVGGSPPDLDGYFSDQLRALIQGVPLRLSAPPVTGAPTAALPWASWREAMPTPVLDETAYQNSDTLRVFLERVGREASGDLVPTLMLLKEAQWHPTVCWLAQPDNVPMPPVAHWSQVPFPMKAVVQFKVSLMPAIEAAILAIRGRLSPVGGA